MTPRPYQHQAIDELRQGIRTHPGQPGLLVAPTGSGKSEIFGWMARAAVAKGKRVGAVVNRRILVRDLCKRVERLGLDYGVIMGSAPRKAWSPVHVASFDTLWRREQLPKWDLVFVDECITGDALVRLADGSTVPISDPSLKGKLVVTFDEDSSSLSTSVVRDWRCSGIRETILIRTEHGSIQCTRNHRIFTDRGWEYAGNLSPGDRIARLPNSQNSPGANWGSSTELFSATPPLDTHTPSAALQGCMETTDQNNADGLPTRRLCSRRFRWLRPRLPMGVTARRILDTAQGSTSAFVRYLTSFARMVDTKRYRSDGSKALPMRGWLGGTWMTDLFRTTLEGPGRLLYPCTPMGTDTTSSFSFRSGLPREDSTLTSLHQAEAMSFCGSPLDHPASGSERSVTTPSPQCPISFDSILVIHPAGSRNVYDLELQKNHCFFANELLVHNCHFSLADKYAQVLARLQADGCIIIGMTATPIRGVLEGLGAIYKWMVRCPDTPDLIDAGYLVPPRVFAPPPPDLKGVPLVAGEYNQKQLAVACNSTKITGDILKHWIANGRGRPTIGFGVDIKHCKDMAAAFCAASVRAIAIDHTYKGDFDLVWRKLANYETEVVFNVGIAGYGWDCPPCSMMIEARPTMSLGLWLQHCLDAKTEILTPDGWKTHADIAVGSRVAAFDMKTSAIKWLPATDVVRRPLTKQEAMYEIRSPHLDIRVTDNHDMIFRSLGKTAVNWRKGTAELLSSKPSHFRLPVCGNQQSTGVQLSDYDLRFIGWFLTDGTLGKDNNQITISQAEGKKENEDIAEVLRGCGFKYGVTRVVRKGELAHCRPLLQYRISKGLPRGSQKHLTGWGRLEPFIDKRLSEWLEFLTRTQLLILLSAMNLGDGTKDNRSWTRRTMEINCGDNSVMAERIQSLCVRRGLRCNITTARNVGRKPWHTLRISLRQSATVGGGCSEEGRSRMAVSPSTHGELVWCVTNDLGAIVTRRNGKVAIVGNCGRVMRVHPGKQDAIINDHAGNSHRHGLPNWPRDWSLDGEAIRHGPGDGAMSVTTCRACYATFKSGPEKCPYCGKLLPKKAREVKIEDGELAEFQPATPKPMSPSAQLGLYAVLRKTQEMRGYKPAWCAMVFKSKTGHFPPGQWRQRTLEELEAALPKKMEVVQL